MKVRLNDISLNYIEQGQQKGLPLIFIHGFPFSLEMWEPQMQILHNTIHAIAYDVRGHGASDVGDGQYTIEFFVDDLVALLDHLYIEKVILCGLSMGGYIALRFFERYPERTKGLILSNTKSEADTQEAKVKRSHTIKAIKTLGVREFAEDFVKSIFAAETFHIKPDTIEHIKRIILNTSPLGICGTLLALASRTDTTAILSSIKVPSLILVGEHDVLTPPSTAHALHEKISGSELHMLPKAAHMSNLENTELFNKIFTAFLKKNW